MNHRRLAPDLLKWLTLTTLVWVIALPAQAGKKRGVWFWGDSSSPYGAANVVGNNTLENQTIAFFNNRKIKLVYGSYGDRLITEPGVISAWNVKLQNAGIESQSLMAENTWIFPTNRPSLLSKISDRLLAFNNAPGRLPAERFDALHLDIEPQGLDDWTTFTAAVKRDHVLLLRDTLVEVRQHLINEGEPGFPVYADLPVWFDNHPGGSIGWLSATERDQWFDDVAAALTGITLMPFERDTIGSITNGMTWEFDNIAGATLRVGHLVDVGNTWPTLPDFNAMMESIESIYGTRATDIQKYSDWREEIAAMPIIAIAATLEHAVALPGGTVAVPAEADWTFSLLHSIDLCSWLEIARVRSPQQGRLTFPVEFKGHQGFWKVERFQERTPAPP